VPTEDRDRLRIEFDSPPARLSKQLEAHPAITTAHRVDQRLLLKVMGAGAISQTAWLGGDAHRLSGTTSR
jgi:hypothetical protein